jgi:hypothetical protein
MSPKKWTEVSQSSDEKLFFIALSLNQDKEWRSPEGLASELKWPAEKVTRLLVHYAKMGVVVQHPVNPNLWGYWERIEQANAPRSED